MRALLKWRWLRRIDPAWPHLDHNFNIKRVASDDRFVGGNHALEYYSDKQLRSWDARHSAVAACRRQKCNKFHHKVTHAISEWHVFVGRFRINNRNDLNGNGHWIASQPPTLVSYWKINEIKMLKYHRRLHNSTIRNHNKRPKIQAKRMRVVARGEEAVAEFMEEGRFLAAYSNLAYNPSNIMGSHPSAGMNANSRLCKRPIQEDYCSRNISLVLNDWLAIISQHVSSERTAFQLSIRFEWLLRRKSAYNFRTLSAFTWNPSSALAMVVR